MEAHASGSNVVRRLSEFVELELVNRREFAFGGDAL
jgi:hypothetical protein